MLFRYELGSVREQAFVMRQKEREVQLKANKDNINISHESTLTQRVVIVKS